MERAVDGAVATVDGVKRRKDAVEGQKLSPERAAATELEEALLRCAQLEAAQAELQEELEEQAEAAEKELERQSGGFTRRLTVCDVQLRRADEKQKEQEQAFEARASTYQEAIATLEEEKKQLIESDAYLLHMEELIHHLRWENTTLTGYRGMYLDHRRMVLAEKFGEVCVRCGCQILWRDFWAAGCPRPRRYGLQDPPGSPGSVSHLRRTVHGALPDLPWLS